MRSRKPLSAIAGMLLLGCASVPPSSVDLSRALAAGIAKSHAAQVATLDAFYQGLGARNDEWILDTVLPTQIATAQQKMSAACIAKGDRSASCSALTAEDFSTITRSVIEFRDSVQAALHENRMQVQRIVGEHYQDLTTANAAITALLESAVDVESATDSARGAAAAAVGVDLDLDRISGELDEFLDKAGGLGASVGDLEASLRTVVDAFRGGDAPTANEEGGDE